MPRLIGGPRQRPCLKCGRPVALEDEHIVRIHGEVLHPRCALYRPRRGA